MNIEEKLQELQTLAESLKKEEAKGKSEIEFDGDDSEESKKEEDAEKKGESCNEELTMEDFSQEELEAFMVSEEFEQLDELSKATLGRYVKKAAYRNVRLGQQETELEKQRDSVAAAMHNAPSDVRPHLSTAERALSKKRWDVTNKMQTRQDGIGRAVKRLTKESQEQTVDLGNLFDGEELSEEFKNKVTTVFEAAVATAVSAKVAELEESFAQKALQESTELEESLADKVDGYLAFMVEQWMNKNELAINRGIKTEILESFVGSMKQVFESHYIDVPDEKYDLVEAAEANAAELEQKLDEQVSLTVELTRERNDLIRKIKIDEAAQGMVATDAERFRQLAEELTFTEEGFEGKLNVIKENYFAPSKQTTLTESFVSDTPVQLEEEVAVDQTMSRYLSVFGRK